MSRIPYSLPENECERLKRSEMNGLRMMLAHLSSARYFQDDIASRLDCIPNGKQRLALAIGGLRAVCNDIIGTITKSQAKQILNTMLDYDLRLLPKATPGNDNVLLTKEQGMALMDMAREKCHACVEDGTGCRSCQLYQILESTAPLEDYGDGLICPYALAEWE